MANVIYGFYYKFFGDQMQKIPDISGIFALSSILLQQVG